MSRYTEFGITLEKWLVIGASSAQQPPCFTLVPGSERGGGHEVEDPDHGHLTEISSRTCEHVHMRLSANTLQRGCATVVHPTLDCKVHRLPFSLHADPPIWRVDVGEGSSSTHDGQHIT